MQNKKPKKPKFKSADSGSASHARIENVVNFDNTDELEDVRVTMPDSESEPQEYETDAPFFAVTPVKTADTLNTTRQMDSVTSGAPAFADADNSYNDYNDVNATRMMDAVGGDVTPVTAPPVAAPKPTPPKPKTISEKKKQALKKRMKRRQEHIRTFSHIFGSLLLVAFIITVSGFLSNFVVRAFLDFTGINVVEFAVFIEIEPDTTTEEIAEILSDNEIITMPNLFVQYAKISGKDGGYLNGEFRFRSTMSYSQIISTLQNRAESLLTVDVTITEGMTAREIAELLEENYVCRAEDFMEFYKNRADVFAFERRLTDDSRKFNQMEGFLFPDTYEFFVVNGLEDNPDLDTTADAEVVALTMLRHFNAQITKDTYWQIGNMNKEFEFEFGLNEFVTLASMVQSEAAIQEDMQKVASVFINRLKSSDSGFALLQSDPTRNYADENIKPYRTSANASQLDIIMRLFDTYESAGLPPGPINNPGNAAMLAVLSAPKTDYYFFCADIETGQTFFAKTPAEHYENEKRAGIRDANGNLIYR
ncbi:MAG: endolytic transglycosylase MltG [Oscillospiraceae bacterium]|nr:endolytic transglycosylase MltG [Oscillospiraceae bacterium]